MSINSKYFILFILLVITCLGINVAKNYSREFDGDTYSLLLMATGPLTGLGVPYKDFWEYKPPGIFLLVEAWAKIFNFSIFSLKILQISVVAFTVVLVYPIMKKIFSSFYTFVIGGLAAVVFLSPYFLRNFLPSEIFGLFFSLSGLVCLLYFKNPRIRFFSSAFLFFIAGQMKDPFQFTILAMFPPLIYQLMSRNFKSFWKSCLYIILGLLTGVVLLGGYLFNLGSLNAYFEVLSTKSRVFNAQLLLSSGEIITKFLYDFWHAKNIIIFFQYLITPVIIIWFLSFSLSLFLKRKLRFPLLKRKKEFSPTVAANLEIEFSPKTVDILTVVFYSLGSFLGFAMGDKFDFHYLLQIVFPLYFLLGIIIKSTLDNFRVLLLPVLIIFLLPKGPYLKSYIPEDFGPQNFAQKIYRNLMVADYDDKLYGYIKSQTKSTSCILSVYGWGVGKTYIYAQRRPCTRFFLANITVEDWQKKEYRESIQRNPPEAIVYSTEGADMNVAQFEQEVINLTQIIKKCYEPDSQYLNLYFPRYPKEQLKICVKQNSL